MRCKGLRTWLGVDRSKADAAMGRSGNGAELVRVHDGAVLSRRRLARAITDAELGIEEEDDGTEEDNDDDNDEE